MRDVDMQKDGSVLLRQTGNYAFVSAEEAREIHRLVEAAVAKPAGGLATRIQFLEAMVEELMRSRGAGLKSMVDELTRTRNAHSGRLDEQAKAITHYDRIIAGLNNRLVLLERRRWKVCPDSDD